MRSEPCRRAPAPFFSLSGSAGRKTSLQRTPPREKSSRIRLPHKHTRARASSASLFHASLFLSASSSRRRRRSSRATSRNSLRSVSCRRHASHATLHFCSCSRHRSSSDNAAGTRASHGRSRLPHAMFSDTQLRPRHHRYGLRDPPCARPCACVCLCTRFSDGFAAPARPLGACIATCPCTRDSNATATPPRKRNVTCKVLSFCTL